MLRIFVIGRPRCAAAAFPAHGDEFALAAGAADDGRGIIRTPDIGGRDGKSLRRGYEELRRGEQRGADGRLFHEGPAHDDSEGLERAPKQRTPVSQLP